MDYLEISKNTAFQVWIWYSSKTDNLRLLKMQITQGFHCCRGLKCNALLSKQVIIILYAQQKCSFYHTAKPRSSWRTTEPLSRKVKSPITSSNRLISRSNKHGNQINILLKDSLKLKYGRSPRGQKKMGGISRSCSTDTGEIYKYKWCKDIL